MKNVIRMTILAVLLGLTAGAAVAAPQTYIIDNSHTFPRFSYNHSGFSRQQNRFNVTSGTIIIDHAAKTASVEVVIDTLSVDTGFPLFTKHIQGEDFLNTAKYPTATFKSTKVNFKGDKPDTVVGNLTLKGITRPVTLKIESFSEQPNPFMKKDGLGANASTKVLRTDFNMGKYAPQVGDEVTIDISVEALKQ